MVRREEKETNPPFLTDQQHGHIFVPLDKTTVFLFSIKAKGIVLVFNCCVTEYLKLSGLKQHLLFHSFLGNDPGMTQLNLLPLGPSAVYDQGVGQYRSLLNSQFLWFCFQVHSSGCWQYSVPHWLSPGVLSQFLVTWAFPQVSSVGIIQGQGPRVREVSQVQWMLCPEEAVTLQPAGKCCLLITDS